MHARYRVFLDYINFRGKLYVNHSGGYSIGRTPELRWLLKRGHIKQIREHSCGKGYTVLVPTAPYEVKRLLCPCCGVDIIRPPTQLDAWWTRIDHKFNCSLRLDHSSDKSRMSHKDRNTISKRRRSAAACK